jgi:peptide/nickel transport system ATP-binding protein
MALVEAQYLTKVFATGDAFTGPNAGLRAVDDVSFAIEAGETLGLVGESGCGKSTLGRMLLRLIEPTSGKVRFDGIEITALGRRALRESRREMQIIFQDPFSSLNPRMSAGDIVGEPLLVHGVAKGAELAERVAALFEQVGLRAAQMRGYPHEFSGGMRQRAMIAMALACNPKVLLADEPTTALDVTIQAQIIDLILELQKDLGTALILITHDLGVVAETAQRVIVMYAGRKVEEAPVAELFRSPKHPYTQGLLGAVPRLGSSLAGTARRLAEIPGQVPSLKQRIEGCVFAGRCPLVTDLCRTYAPGLEEKAPHHIAACHYAVKAAVAA